MTAVLTPPSSQGATTSSSPLSQTQQQAQAPAPAPAQAFDAVSSKRQSTASTTSPPNVAVKSKAQHLTAPATAASPEQLHSSGPRSRSRDPPSRRQSRLSTRTVSTRPASSVFPIFLSSLSYALVRDFAYPAFHPMHYGPQPYEGYTHSESGTSSPTYNGSYGGGYGYDRRLSDPPPSWEGSRGMWSAGPWGGDGGAVFGIEGGGVGGDQLPSTSFGYDSDDPDGISAGKLAKNHRKSKSFAVGEEATGAARRRRSDKGGRKKDQKKDMSHLGTGLDSQGFFQPGATDEDDDELPRASYHTESGDHDGSHHEHHNPDDGSLDESFAGPSLALYTFQPENANELALREGQIIQVGYRHGQGWLVAMDLETGEQGLVPEEYVRLLSDIEGWGEEDEVDYQEQSEQEHDTTERDVQHMGTIDNDAQNGEGKLVGTETALRQEEQEQAASSSLPVRSKTEAQP